MKRTFPTKLGKKQQHANKLKALVGHCYSTAGASGGGLALGETLSLGVARGAEFWDKWPGQVAGTGFVRRTIGSVNAALRSVSHSSKEET